MTAKVVKKKALPKGHRRDLRSGALSLSVLAAEPSSGEGDEKKSGKGLAPGFGRTCERKNKMFAV